MSCNSIWLCWRNSTTVRSIKPSSPLSEIAFYSSWDAQEDAGEEVRGRVSHLETRFNQILERFRPPAFGEEQSSSIDRKTYLPIYRGRRFDTLSSLGWQRLVGLAYSLAHHVAAIELGLKLPRFSHRGWIERASG